MARDARTLSVSIIVASCVTAAFFYFRTLTPYWRWEAVVVPAVPFVLLGTALVWAHPSRFVPAICTLAVAFAGIAVAFHYLDVRYRSPMDPDPDMVWFPVAVIIVPVELSLAGLMLLAVYLERRKR